ncbi:MAG: o-succinylbenzoate synthase [Ktedonobacterales bacterium]|nr:o-succinylbenzoate synthase [Ktedonobacterales bacterium]
MIITDIRYYPYRVPFKRPFTTAHGTLMAREGVIVELVTDAGISGYGDMAAVTEFGAPDVATLLRVAREVEPQFVEKDPMKIPYSSENWADGGLPGPLTFAIETAIGSVMKRFLIRLCEETPEGAGFAEWFIRPFAPVRLNATIGAVSIDEAVKTAIEAKIAGFTCIKLKVGMLGSIRDEVERIFAVRAAIGPSIHFRLDANEAWSFDDALAIMQQLGAMNIQFVEQPLIHTALAEIPKLRARVAMPIGLDETVSDYASYQQVSHLADVFILKPQMLGRIATEKIVHQNIRHRNLVMTTSLESGIGVVATLKIASNLRKKLLECGLATLSLLEDDLIQEEIVIKNGMMYPPTAPVTPDWDALARYRLDVEGQ